jgi:2-polyprenyl-3-methyl-5-hydroxy-6-metoxy-1,4-benzoquinol methylase
MKNYLDVNRKSWNERVAHHLTSDFYGMKEFLAGKSSLKEIELPLLGEVKGKSILHLQCHFGQDSLSLARMGAKVTGLDFSDVAIHEAKRLNDELGLNANFICSDVYDTPRNISDTYDIVFTTYGTIGWLPDIRRWAEVVAKMLKPGGKLIFAEFHPFIWTFDDNIQHLTYSYFNRGTIEEVIEGTYADRSAPEKFHTVSWNHGLGEVISALMEAGLSITSFKEYDYSPYDCFANMRQKEAGKFVFDHVSVDIPMVYRIEGRREG